MKITYCPIDETVDTSYPAPILDAHIATLKSALEGHTYLLGTEITANLSIPSGTHGNPYFRARAATHGLYRIRLGSNHFAPSAWTTEPPR